MLRSLALLGTAVLTFAGAITAEARLAMPQVADDVIMGDALPRTLEDFKFFVDPESQLPTKGVIPYRLNMPLFSDGADKLRFLYLSSGTQARSMGADLLDLPVGAALIKTFAFGEGADRRLVETRVLLHRADGWVALPYRWNEQQTAATLALAGARVDLTMPRGEQISYRIPNKNQCKECHGLNGAVVPIGPKGRNLSADWLMQMIDTGKLDTMDDGMDTVPQWESRRTMPAAQMARAYLDVNCAHCHRPGATASNSGLDLRLEQRDPQAIGIFKRPVAAGRGSGGFDFDIVPGKPGESILLHRMKVQEPGIAMPELGKATVDAEGTALIERWILEMGQ
ncbi:hypothetical protein OAS19_05985 [Altererythrobacter sp.]|nr:hypothetical protein [Altererythrobacter sp.]